MTQLFQRGAGFYSAGARPDNRQVGKLLTIPTKWETPVRVLITETEIHERVCAMGRQIGRDFAGQPLTIIGVLTGSLVFLADLTRQLAIPHRLGVLQASSYRGATTEPGPLHMNLELVPDLEGRHVLLLDDILDTGHTLATLVEEVKQLGPLSVRTAVLLRKRGRQSVPFEPDYCGFEIPDVFVVGYGLDFHDEFRHLPHLAGLDPEDIEAGVIGSNR
jgi:hypoxanthine phosphoribosyltransferase